MTIQISLMKCMSGFHCIKVNVCVRIEYVCVAGLVLVTDAVTAMGLPPGRHTLGQQQIDIQGLHAYVAGLPHVLSAFSV